MGMEGINWEGVNAEAKAIFEIVRNAEDDLYKKIDNFGDELSLYWASGNAVEFSRKFFDAYKQTVQFMENKVDLLESYISRAAQIYSTTFNVGNGFKFNGQDWLPNVWSDITKGATVLGDNIAGGFGDFQTQKNGVTGINKIAAQNCLDTFKGTLSTYLSELGSSLTNRDIALFDIQQAQKEAYNVCVEDMKKGINDNLSSVLELVTNAINTEVDNSRLAKEQTVSTFSA